MTQFTLGLTGSFAHGRAFSEVSPVPNPAVANGFAIPIESKYWERLASLSFQLVTDGNAANRQVALTVRGGDGVALATFPAASVQAASLTYQYTFAPQLSSFNTVVGLAVTSPGPAWFLQPQWSLVVTIGAVQVGDQVSNIRYNRERFTTGPGGYQQGTVTDAEDRELALARLVEILS